MHQRDSGSTAQCATQQTARVRTLHFTTTPTLQIEPKHTAQHNQHATPQPASQPAIPTNRPVVSATVQR